MSKSQHVLVTGAGGDIGTAIVQHFLDKGATITAVDIKSEAEILKRYAPADHGRIKAITLDLCDQAAVTNLINSGAPLDCVIGNAGVGGTAAFVDIDPTFWQRTLDVNLTANFILGQVAAKHFIKNKTAGRIVFTGSWVGSVPWPEITAYTVSKAGLEMLAKQMARACCARNQSKCGRTWNSSRRPCWGVTKNRSGIYKACWQSCTPW